jgi:hypothetical protein
MSSDQKDWRLRLDLGQPLDLAGELKRSGVWLPDDVVLSRDDNTLFVYAMHRESLASARTAVEQVLQRAGLTGTIAVSHWDPHVLRWRQVDPPPPEAELRRDQEEVEAERTGADATTQTVVCTIGRLIRKPFEQEVVSFAEQEGLRCEVVEHPHLLSSQVVFTVTGEPERVEEFVDYVRKDARSTTRIDPGLIPFGLP